MMDRYLAAPRDILLVNDATLYLQAGCLTRFVALLDSAATAVINAYAGAYFSDGPLTRHEQRLTDTPRPAPATGSSGCRNPLRPAARHPFQRRDTILPTNPWLAPVQGGEHGRLVFFRIRAVDESVQRAGPSAQQNGDPHREHLAGLVEGRFLLFFDGGKAVANCDRRAEDQPPLVGAEGADRSRW